MEIGENKSVLFSESRRRKDILFSCLLVILVFIFQYIYSIEYFKGNVTLRNGLIIPLLIRLLTWSFPVILYLALRKINIFEYLKLDHGIIKGIIWGLILGGTILIIKIVGNYLYYGTVNINLNFGLNRFIVSVLLVGLSEDILFRGFILQKANEYTKFWIANVINAILFTLIHYPGWFLEGNLNMQKLIVQSLYVLIFALLQGYILKKTKSLWACMIVHSFNNFMSFALP